MRDFLALRATLFVQETILRAIYATCAADISRAAFRGLLFCCSRAANMARKQQECTRGYAKLCASISGEPEALSLFRPVDR